MIKSKNYICPNNKSNLFIGNKFLFTKKYRYKVIKNKETHNKEVIDFIDKAKTDNFYKEKKFYKNYLNWLSKTLMMSLQQIRKEIFSKIEIKKRSSILFIGCGFGDEINFFIRKYGKNHKIFAQDISKSMVLESCKNVKLPNVKFSISAAENLPYIENSFDLIFHFGGFNQFKNKKKSIDEMYRACKENGTIFLSDEGMGPWFYKSESYKALKINNSLWSSKPPISLIPDRSTNVILNWILKNNFYCIMFQKRSSFQKINYNVKHKSPRGGSVKTRYEVYYKKKLIIR